MNKRLLLITAATYIFIASTFLLFKYLLKERPIQASLYPRQVYINEPIHFYDSTENASVIWEFGNGDKTGKKYGSYIFKEIGKYKIRLTINQNTFTTFLVDVLPKKTFSTLDSTISIDGDNSGITGQKIHVKAVGKNITWSEWHFNGFGKIDSKAIEAFYAYNKPGTYEILLLTNLNPIKPQRHLITIESPYKITENIILKPAKKNAEAKKTAFKDLLQEISYGTNSIANYNYLVKNFLCSNPKTLVIINGSTTSDFYSYCQGLQLNGNVLIKNATIEMNSQTGCASKVFIQQ